MTLRKSQQPDDFTSRRVLILCGPHKGQEGVCVGRAADGKRWAVSPEGSNEVLQLVFEKEFGLLLDLSANPDNN
jgi:hypothetical protein